MTVDVQLHGMGNRELIAGVTGRALHGEYRTTMPAIQEKRTLQRSELAAEPRKIAVDISRQIFLRFGFNASEPVMTEYQGELFLK
jgi:hypothetical protein